MKRALLSGLLLAALGCQAEPRLLVVDVRTDYLPNEEFASVTAEILPEIGEPEVARLDTLEGSFQEGVRVVERELLADSVRVELALRDDEGRVVVARPVLIDLAASQAVTVLLSRRCAEVVCDAADQACLLGRCVSASCVEENATACASPECASAAECTAGPACAVGECTASGGCLYLPSDAACGAGERCHPTRGCEAVDPPPPPPPPGPCDGVTETDPTAIGDGTEANPYLLCTVEQLVDWLGAPGADVMKLGQDIDLTGLTLAPVTFAQGTLDGGGHAIVGAQVSGATGLFSSLGGTATLRDVRFVDLSVDGATRVGGGSPGQPPGSPSRASRSPGA